jgi:hypothetical protein
MKVLERIVPDWFHRNDGQKAKMPSRERPPASKAQPPPQKEKIPDGDTAEADDDEAAHAQHPRHGGAIPKPRKKQPNGKMDTNIPERGSRHGGPRKTAANSTDNAVKEKIAADYTDNAVNDNEAKNATGDKSDRPKSASTSQAAGVSSNDKKKAELDKADKSVKILADAGHSKSLSSPITKAPLANDSEKTAGDLKSVQRTLENMDTIRLQSSCPATLSAGEIRTTLVIQSSLERLWILVETCKRWKSPIVLAVHLPHHSPENHPSIVAAKEKCSELTVVPYRATEEEQEWEYPVNRLRNMALDAVRTSHVLTIDIDFIPSMFLDELIRSTVLEQQALIDYSEREAMIVPAFERLPPEPCSKENDCSVHLKTNSSFIPQTLNELRSCTMKKECSVFQFSNNWEGHYSTRSESWLKGDWYEAEVSSVPNNATGRTAPKRIRTIKCFDSLRYEPYVVLRWCPVSNNSTDRTTPISPYYDERFYGYGKNKIELISHLRFMGYHFSVLPIGFIIHNPHFESAAKQTWNDVKANDLHQQMDSLYPKFLDELWNKYKKTTKFIVQQCKRLKTNKD